MTTTRRHIWQRRITAALALALTAGTLLAQPGAGGPRPGAGDETKGPGERPRGPRRPDAAPAGPGGAGEQQAPVDPAAAKAFVHRALERARTLVTLLERASSDLDAGRDVSELRREFEQFRREDNREWARFIGQGARGPGGGGPGGGPGVGAGGSLLDGDQGPGRPLTDDERERVRTLIEADRPELMTLIRETARDNAAQADRLLEGLGNRVRGLHELKERDPAHFKLRLDDVSALLKVGRARRAYFEAINKQPADAGAVEKARAEVVASLRTSMEIGAKVRDRDLELAEQRLARTKAEHAKLRAEFDKVLAERTEQMLKPSGRRGSGDVPGGSTQPPPPPGPPGKGPGPEAPDGPRRPRENGKRPG